MATVPKKAGAVGKLAPKEAKKLWTRLEKEKQFEEQEQKRLQGGSSYIDDRNLKDPETLEAQDDWKRLLQQLKVSFPEALADKFELRPKQKAAALAKMLGWTQEKISKASGVAKRTLYTWFRNPEILEFQKAFEYYTGTRDGKDMLDREIYPSIITLKDIRDDTKSPASVRRDISQWFYEQKYGKAKETREIKGQNIKELTQELMNLRKNAKDDIISDITIEEEEDPNETQH